MKHIPKQSGYSLIEVMIAVVVLSIGLAALGLLQVSNVKNSYNSHNRSMATAAAQDMAERLRSNLSAYELGHFKDPSSGTVNTSCYNGLACTPEQIAENDIATWRTNLAQILPAGSGVVCTDGATINDGEPGAEACDGTGNTVVKVFWRESADFSSLQTDDVDSAWQVYALVIYP